VRYLDFFEDVYYINLDYRADRRLLFEDRSQAVGIEAVRFSAAQPAEEDCPLLPGSIGETRRRFKVGCTMSHQGVVQLAKSRGLANVLIFEDDCIFEPGFKAEAQKCVDELRQIDWDILYFGGEVNNYCKSISENLVTVNNGGVYCCHAYAVNAKFYDKFLAVSPHHTDIIDIYLLNYPANQRNYILSRKLLALQDPIFSDLKNGPSELANGYMLNSWKKFIPNE
jgi:GR25 family glycosyltransferase involved in LPS biosynthesis